MEKQQIPHGQEAVRDDKSKSRNGTLPLRHRIAQNRLPFSVAKDPMAAHSSRSLRTCFTPGSEARHSAAAALGATIMDEAARRCITILDRPPLAVALSHDFEVNTA
jgi:hypothetical protein